MHIINVIYDGYLWEFGTVAEAHDAYLITELGNLFLVKDLVSTSNVFEIIIREKMEALADSASRDFGSTDWFLLHGRDDPVTRTEFFINPLTMDAGTQHAGVIQGDTVRTDIPIALFGYNYTYNNGALINPVQYPAVVSALDIVQHRQLSGSQTVSNSFAGVQVTGTGMTAMRIGSSSLPNFVFSGEIPSGGEVRVVTSPNNLIGSNVRHDGSKFVLYDNTVESEVTGFRVTSISNRVYWDCYPSYFISPNYPYCQVEGRVGWGPGSVSAGLAAAYATGYADPPSSSRTPENTVQYYVNRALNAPRIEAMIFMMTDDDYGPAAATPRVFVKDGANSAISGVNLASSSTTLSSSTSGAYTRINSITINERGTIPEDCFGRFEGPCVTENFGYDSTSHIRIRDTAPYDQVNLFNRDFVQDYINFPSNAFLLIKPNGGTVTLRADDGTGGALLILGIDNLPPDTYYSITIAGMEPFYGKTTRDGRIILTTDHIALGNANQAATLTLYEGALTSMEVSPSNIDLGTILFDIRNDQALLIGNAVEIHVPFFYGGIPTIDGTVVADVYLNGTSGRIDLPYLNGIYFANESIDVPQIEGFETVHLTMDGQSITVRYEDL